MLLQQEIERPVQELNRMSLRGAFGLGAGPGPVGAVDDRRALCITWGDPGDPEKQAVRLTLSSGKAGVDRGASEENLRLELGFRTEGAMSGKGQNRHLLCTFCEPGPLESSLF